MELTRRIPRGERENGVPINQAGSCTLVDPKHRLEPLDLLNFTELSGFIADWEELGLMSKGMIARFSSWRPRSRLFRLETGGLKLEFSPPSGISGKAETELCRACYSYFEEFTRFLVGP